MRERLIRSAGVIAHWAGLLLAILGWLSLRKDKAQLAQVLLLYALGFTILHLPLVMSTRIRIPLVDPLVVMLSGAGWLWVARKMTWGHMERPPISLIQTPDSVVRRAS